VIVHVDKVKHKYPPRENQVIAINETVEDFIQPGFHGLLLEMSLGKSKCILDTARIMRSYGALDRIIIICAKVIQSVWVEEIPKHTFAKEPPFIYENKDTHKYKKQLKAALAAKVPIIIVRLELFQRKNKVLQEFLTEYFTQPTLVILDESSKIKNVDTERTPRLIEYTRGSAYRAILTGTPWTESPLDIFSQMEFLQTGFWYRYNGEWGKNILKKHWYIFRNRYAIMQKIITGEGRTFQVVVGTRRTEEIARKIQPYITQQKKADWLDLPDKIYQTLHVELNKEQKQAYKQLKQELILEYGDKLLTVANTVTLLTRLRQVAGGFYPETGEPIGNPPGIEILLEDVSEYPGKVLISCAYVAEVDGIVKELKKVYGPDQVVTFYGDTQNRDEEKLRFQNDAKFLVGTEQVMAYGHNWQFCSLMYRYSLAFSYERNAQLTDRIHRPGMVGEAVYKDIVHTGTVQEKTIKAFVDKKDVVEAFDKMTMKEFLG